MSAQRFLRGRREKGVGRFQEKPTRLRLISHKQAAVLPAKSDTGGRLSMISAVEISSRAPFFSRPDVGGGALRAGEP